MFNGFQANVYLGHIEIRWSLCLLLWMICTVPGHNFVPFLEVYEKEKMAVARLFFLALVLAAMFKTPTGLFPSKVMGITKIVPRNEFEYKEMTKDIVCNTSDDGKPQFPHYVLSSTRKVVYKVCAPEFPVFGYCLELNEGSKSVQPNHNEKCTNYKHSPCGPVYNSTDSYLFFECFEKIAGLPTPQQQMENLINCKEQIDITKKATTLQNAQIKELEDANSQKNDKIKELENANSQKNDKIKELENAISQKNDKIKKLENANDTLLSLLIFFVVLLLLAFVVICVFIYWYCKTWRTKFSVSVGNKEDNKAAKCNHKCIDKCELEMSLLNIREQNNIEEFSAIAASDGASSTQEEFNDMKDRKQIRDEHMQRALNGKPVIMLTRD